MNWRLGHQCGRRLGDGEMGFCNKRMIVWSSSSVVMAGIYETVTVTAAMDFLMQLQESTPSSWNW